MKRRLLLFFLSPLALAALFLLLSAKKHESKVRLLYWNIQMGMWDGQRDNYDRFVDWVNSKNPDICVWCEGASHVKTESEETIKKEDRFLPGGWPEIAARYGIPVVEDAAEGFGSCFDGKVLGTFGEYGILSFNGN